MGRFFGVEIAPRAADDAIRRYEIGFFKLGRARFTNRTELAAWIESCRVPPGSPYRRPNSRPESQQAQPV